LWFFCSTPSVAEREMLQSACPRPPEDHTDFRGNNANQLSIV
jgi:hypothetical protein